LLDQQSGQAAMQDQSPRVARHKEHAKSKAGSQSSIAFMLLSTTNKKGTCLISKVVRQQCQTKVQEWPGTKNTPKAATPRDMKIRPSEPTSNLKKETIEA
jgi:hypothetical protein